MSNDLYSIGSSALSTSYMSLRTAGNNVANANTPGYTRQTAVLTAATGAFLGGFFVGQGVQVGQIKREYNDFLTQAANQAQSQSAQANTRTERLEQISTLFSDTTQGIGNTIDAFFSAVQSLTQNPGDASTRAAMLSAGKLLSQRFNDVGADLQNMRVSTDAQLSQELDGANQLAAQIAELNDKVALARGNGRAPNELLDRRDAAIRALNGSVRVTGVPQDDGAINLFLANGQPLVVGNRAGTMGMQVSSLDPKEISVGVRDAVGNLIELDPRTVGGGAIGGLLSFRSQDLPTVENRLGQLATTLGDQLNIQHKLGNDRTGAAGGNFFTAPSVAAFGAARNTGSGVITASFTDTTQIQAADYRLQYLGAAGYQLTRSSDNIVSTVTTLPSTIDGVQFNITGTPANGDIFMLQPARNGSRNLSMNVALPDQIAAASPVTATAGAANKGNLKLADLSVVGPTRNASLTNPVTLNFSNASTFTFSDDATNTPQSFTAGTPITHNGWKLTLLGAPVAGDTLAIAATVNGVGDNRNALALAQMPDLSLVSGGRLSGAYGGLVATVGGLAGGARTTQAAQTSILNDALAAESAVAGVNLDEEASKLMQYQQQYQAAAKVIQTARTLFDEVLSLGR